MTCWPGSLARLSVGLMHESADKLPVYGPYREMLNKGFMRLPQNGIFQMQQRFYLGA